MNRITDKNLIPAEEMKLVRVSSENTANQRLAAHAIDGQPHSLWHSKFSGTLEKHPHEMVIDLGAEYQVRGFRYLARQDGGWNGAFAATEFYVSESPTEFGEPVVKTTFVKAKQAQSADCDKPVRGRYVRVRVLSEVNGNRWASAAEIGIIGAK